MPLGLSVEIEDASTWPPEFRRIANENKQLAMAYQHERKRIDKLCQDDVVLRVNPPRNAHVGEYKDLVERLESILQQHSIVGFHCTRLTTFEIEAMCRNGLRILSAEFAHARLVWARDRGDLSQAEFDYLNRSPHLETSLGNEEAHRTGMAWFCPNRSTLQDDIAVYRFFRSWGGEAIYWGHEDDEQIAAALRKIGKPCIVKCKIPFVDARTFSETYAELFLSFLVSDEVEYPHPSPHFDMRVERDIAAAEIVEIIGIDDPRFETLTGYRTWDEQYQINEASRDNPA